jgi:photosystem II stability/assembly factor-like uncharacterized protein
MHALALVPLLLLAVPRTDEPALTAEHTDAIAWRNIGPTAMGGRVIDLAVHPERARIFYVASATGGLWKTTNNGTTFAPVFEHEGSSSVGAVALAPSNPEVVWVGTGEANARNSVSWGDGVYRSDDGGKSWTHAGLAETRHVGAIAVHPTEPEVVFVAAMGRTWGPNPERGLYRTRDAGATWERVLFVDEATGCIDVVIDPVLPDVVYAATYQRQRDAFDSNDPAVQTGPGSGLWRSLDGGSSWERLTAGLPTVDIGRIGLELYAADPRVAFAIIETAGTGERGAPPRSADRVSLGIRGRDAEDGGFLVESVTSGESAAQAGLEEGDLIVAIDGADVAGRADLVAALAGLAPGAHAELNYRRGGEELGTTLNLLGRLEAGRTESFAGSQGGQIANAQGRQGEQGFESGGVFRSEDRGTTWTRINSLNPRPFYYSQIRVNPLDERELWVLGISLHHSDDGGAEFGTRGRGVHPDHHAMWIDPRDPEHVILGNDGGLYVTWDDGATWDHLDVLPICQFYNVAVDTRTPYHVYGGLQDNGSWGGPSATRIGGTRTADWIKTGGGDGFHCAVDPENPDLVYSESQNGAITRLNVRTGEGARVARPQGSRDLRFNWNTPFLLSPHNSSILFYAGNAVIRSIDRGESAVRISPDVARTERGSATALAQSPLDEDVLFVGTDDGALWTTRNGGMEWLPIAEALGVEQPLYVSDIEPSPHRARTVYVTLDGHRSNDERPYVFKSTDDGDTFTSIASNLPLGSVRTIALDPVNESLLFVGTEFGCFVSIDDGGSWAPLGSGLPTVPVHDLVVHPSESDLVAGTHGRGIWIADVAPLQALATSVLAEAHFLFPVQAVRDWNTPPGGEPSGARLFVGENPARGAAIYYWLGADQGGEVELTVRDATGRAVRTLRGPGEAGLHLVRWDLRAQARGRAGQQRRPGDFGRGASAEVGDYAVTLELGEEPPARVVRVLADPLVLRGDVGAQR